MADTLMLAHCSSCGNVQAAEDRMCEVCGIDTVVLEGWEIPLDQEDQDMGAPHLAELVSGNAFLLPIEGPAESGSIAPEIQPPKGGA